MKIDNINFENILSEINLGISQEGAIVTYVGDGTALVEGFSKIMYGEKVLFDEGSTGLVFDINELFVYVFILTPFHNIKEKTFVKRTEEVYSIPVFDELLGHVVDVFIDSIDGVSLNTREKELRQIERKIKGISERVPVDKPLSTGILLVDALIPVGKGQRQLLIGNRRTGKTTAALKAIFNQRSKNVICIYVAIGMRTSELAFMVESLRLENAMDYTVIVSADSEKPAIHHYLAPYVGITIAEYFSDQKRDVLIIYDDLSSHAIAYREMSLLMKRAPGREAFPGDIFYLHARLLERAGNFLDSGSITALPIIQIQEDDLSAYIPTNLISITDGQIFFDTKLFNQDIKPAINTELSVSRVGGAAQNKSINKLSRGLRLDLAQYHDLLSFTQFGGEIDEFTAKKITKGKLLIELLQQDISVIYDPAAEALILFLFKYFYDVLSHLSSKQKLIEWILSYIRINYFSIYSELLSGIALDEKKIEEIKQIMIVGFDIYGLNQL